MSSGKWRPFCLSLNVFQQQNDWMPVEYDCQGGPVNQEWNGKCWVEIKVFDYCLICSSLWGVELEYRKISNIRRTISLNFKCSSPRFAVVFAQSNEARC